MNEDLELELEALVATYEDGTVQVSQNEPSGSKYPTTVTLTCTPRAELDHACYVACQLMLQCPPGYPTTAAPHILLDKCKGLTDTQIRDISLQLHTEATHMTGELQLGHLYELATDLLTTANHPNGDCVFCLQPLIPTLSITKPTLTETIQDCSSNTREQEESTGEYVVVKLPCFHCYHRSCFASWFNWTQTRLQKRAQEIEDEYKSMGHQQMEKEGIERMQDGLFVVKCPACRHAVYTADIEHLIEDLRDHSAEEWMVDVKEQLQWNKDPELLKMQRHMAKVAEAQRRCGGFVDRSVGVSVEEMQRAMENARLLKDQKQTQAEQEQQQKQQQSNTQQQQNNDHSGRGGGRGRGGRKQGGSTNSSSNRGGGYRGGRGDSSTSSGRGSSGNPSATAVNGGSGGPSRPPPGFE